MSINRRGNRIPVAAWTLGALAAGMALGAFAHTGPIPVLSWINSVAVPAGTLYVAAVQATLIPLIVALVLHTILGASVPAVGTLGWRTLAAFLVALMAAGVLSVPLTTALVAVVPLEPALLQAVRAAVTSTPPAAAAAASANWAASILPRNIIQSASAGDLTQVLLFTVAFGAAASRLPEESRRPLANLVASVSETMLKLIGWIVGLAPLGVFALAFTTAREGGSGAIGIVAAFLVIATISMIVLGLLYYPIGAYGARVSLARFAGALVPGQVVAIATRSSLVAVPSLIKSARDVLRLPDAGSGFVIPLSAAVFRPTRPMVSGARLLFLAHVYGVSLSPTAIVLFLGSVILTSFTFAGVPLVAGNSFRSLPFYVAAGIPIEGVVLLDGAEILLDHGRTFVAVTANVALAALLTSSEARAATPGHQLREFAAVITFVIPRRMPLPLTDYLNAKRHTLSCETGLSFYDDWYGRTSFAPGTYVLVGLEWLDAPMRAFLSGVCRQLADRPDIRFLNDPGRTLGRHDLLAVMERTGRNPFRARRIASDWTRLTYPVFVRSESDHNGPLSPLLHTSRAVERAVGVAVLGGYEPADLLVVEYCETADPSGMYTKYAAFIVDDQIVPRNVNFGRGWVLKHELSEYDGALLQSEHDYVTGNPHRVEIAEIAKLAGVAYGRIDYALRAGRITTWEINLNPTIGGTQATTTELARRVREQRKETNAHFYDGFARAIEAIDLPSDGPAIPIAGVAPRMHTMQSTQGRFNRVRRLLEVLPFTGPPCGIIGRAVIAAAQ